MKKSKLFKKTVFKKNLNELLSALNVKQIVADTKDEFFELDDIGAVKKLFQPHSPDGVLCSTSIDDFILYYNADWCFFETQCSIEFILTEFDKDIRFKICLWDVFDADTPSSIKDSFVQTFIITTKFSDIELRESKRSIAYRRIIGFLEKLGLVASMQSFDASDNKFDVNQKKLADFVAERDDIKGSVYKEYFYDFDKRYRIMDIYSELKKEDVEFIEYRFGIGKVWPAKFGNKREEEKFFFSNLPDVKFASTCSVNSLIVNYPKLYRRLESSSRLDVAQGASEDQLISVEQTGDEYAIYLEGFDNLPKELNKFKFVEINKSTVSAITTNSTEEKKGLPHDDVPDTLFDDFSGLSFDMFDSICSANGDEGAFDILAEIINIPRHRYHGDSFGIWGGEQMLALEILLASYGLFSRDLDTPWIQKWGENNPRKPTKKLRKNLLNCIKDYQVTLLAEEGRVEEFGVYKDSETIQKVIENIKWRINS